MIPPALLIYQVVVINPAAGLDSHQNQTKDYGAAATRTDMNARLDQVQRSEAYPDGRIPQEGQWTLFTNDDGVLTADSRVEWSERGITFEAFGPPEPLYNGTVFSHIEATLRILEG